MAASMDVLYQPYSRASQDKAIKGIGHNKGNYVVAFLITLLIFAIVVTVYNGIIYNKIYNENSPETSSDTTTIDSLRSIIRNSGYYDASIAMAVIGVIGFIISITFFTLWHKDYRLELLKENVMGRDIAVSMRAGASVDKVSNLLSSYVHPLQSQTAQRQQLHQTLSNNLRGNFNVLQNVSGPRATAYYTGQQLPPRR
jgi:ABC-type anion transport system duplicated permease subunit